MGVVHTVLVGYGNGEVSALPVRNHEGVRRVVDRMVRRIGRLTKSGFCTIVASAWHRPESKTAGVLYAADWNCNGVEVLVDHGDRIKSSEELYARWRSNKTGPLTSGELIDFCRRLRQE